MSEFDQTDEVQPEERVDEEEYAGTEPGADSEDTGTHYDEQGEPEATPHDLESDDDRPDE